MWRMEGMTPYLCTSSMPPPANCATMDMSPPERCPVGDGGPVRALRLCDEWHLRRHRRVHDHGQHRPPDADPGLALPRWEVSRVGDGGPVRALRLCGE